ncbi:MAG: hypothetical protein IPN38_19175 [Flavobacteriales bacterium]|nr:hypothetical protein [Flavobacteriales bacterium]
MWATPCRTARGRAGDHTGRPHGHLRGNHSATTDAYGLIALTIGQGTPVGGSAIATFADVEWASGQPITYSVAVDVTGGTNHTFLSGGPFKAVPFAMHALTSDSSTTSVPQTLTLSNDTLYITGGNGVDLSGLVKHRLGAER